MVLEAMLLPFCENLGWHSVTPFLLERGGLSLIPNFQKGEGWTGSRGKRVAFFRGSCNFYIKSKLKSEIFNDKKGL